MPDSVIVADHEWVELRLSDFEDDRVRETDPEKECDFDNVSDMEFVVE